jgi:polyisoprenoid-binding protein YceI
MLHDYVHAVEDRLKALISLFLMLVLMNVPLQSEEYRVLVDGRNTVTFSSKATIESFSGTTNKIDGYVVWDGADPLHNNELYFEVPLETLDTGIGLRNRHMRENYLQTEKYPLAKYQGKLVKFETINDSTYSVSVEGKMTLHGVENGVALNGTVIVKEERLRVTAPFQIKLADYRIKVPQFMFLKINEVLDMVVDFQMFKFSSK